jgi:hypothetical protein
LALGHAIIGLVGTKEVEQRMEHVEESAKAQDEEQCIETFLNWHNRRFKTNLSYKRAEKEFPEIGKSTRWDFVIRGNECPPWYGAEIKRLIKPEARIQLVHWNKSLRNITNSLVNQLQGEFLVYGVPPLKLERHKGAQLKRVLTKLLLQNAASLKKNDMVNLGPQILRLFKEWPSTPHLNPNPPYDIEHRVNVDSCFTLHKISDTGCSLELGFAQSGVFRLDQAVVEALTSLFGNGEILKANTQLALAKQKGAKGTILLLDYDLPSWYPDDTRQVLANNLNSGQSSNMDAIYLVKASQNRVSKVWGTTKNIFSTG